MTECLFVVIGAGASFASTSPENVATKSVTGTDPLVLSSALRPPLVTELFDPRFAGILNKYPVAQMAASDIRRQTKTPIVIEEYLRTRYRDSTDDLDRRKFHAVHWYLQDLLWSVSKTYTSHPDNYDRLITGCLRLPRVVFITLNYDTLLDDRLRIVGDINTIDEYVHPDRPWWLVKLHGSVDWGKPIHGDVPSAAVQQPPADLVVGDRIELRLSETLHDVRFGTGRGDHMYYPAMSIPVGTRDEFSCPDDHVARVRDLMAGQHQLDVLMLGYSALDEEVLTLFLESGKALRSLYVVNADETTAAQARQRVVSVLGGPSLRTGGPYKKSFADFVGTDDFDAYLQRL